MSSREVEVKGTQTGGLVYPELIKPAGGPVNPENNVEVSGLVSFVTEEVQEGIKVGGQVIGGPVSFSPESK
jgi:hypothetical protein